ncbi:MAG: hypothetical protein ABI878_03720 [Acidobacteriota bacterium]
MSSVAREWLAVFLFVFCFFGLTTAEALWLSRSSWMTLGRGLVFAAGTNILGFCIGLFASFVILGIILAMAWDGSLNQVPGNDSMLWFAMVSAVLITPVLLIILKRLLLWFLKVGSGSRAWLYSFAVSVLIFVLTLGVPSIFFYFVL